MKRKEIHFSLKIHCLLISDIFYVKRTELLYRCLCSVSKAAVTSYTSIMIIIVSSRRKGRELAQEAVIVCLPLVYIGNERVHLYCFHNFLVSYSEWRKTSC